jgi:WhiB family redox-sensing transcriptional regulator
VDAGLAVLETTWRAAAACHDGSANAFYPPSTTENREQRQEREAEARALCRRCGVRQTCLEYALYVQEPYGIWGGLTELERRRLLRTRAGGAG